MLSVQGLGDVVDDGRLYAVVAQQGQRAARVAAAVVVVDGDVGAGAVVFMGRSVGP
ncbi:hypothetical protein ACHFCA_29320 [Delftia tsuruhatensis]